MLNLDRIQKNERLMRAMFGLSIKQFNELVDVFDRNYEKAIDAERAARGCVRKKGGGQKARLSTPSLKLSFILIYLKCYPTYDVQAVLFDLDAGNCCDWVKRLLPVLESTLGEKQVLPVRKICSIDEFLQHFPGEKDLLIDATERRTQRSSNNKTQRKHFSGKQRAHTRKNIAASNPEKKILFLSPTKAGHYHDKKMFDKETSFRFIPSDCCLWLDKGFQGVQHVHKNIMQPKKKPQNRELTIEEKEENKVISALRMPIENVFAGLKRMNCLYDVYRNRNGQDDKFIFLAAGLWNFNLECRG
ncbi:transposase family protein [Candidatus Venteria ishoeyi]|uniref:Transposase DDE domain protein n=7 Tax=Candidatus Venteria ishoeyi TaxID=1899563 RepID=A0A1H6F6I7_9GAMM|nr:transposase family protein [Candidatus Venteria ishoeyi]SEH05143.1 Transposase DDE domain protein [Candidatus Venteria ishoeyi]